MMSKIAEKITAAWLAGKRFTMSNTWTDGTRIVLYNTKIAERTPDGSVWIGVGDYNTVTTRDRLNEIPGVAVCMDRGKLFLNGREWDGTWTCVSQGTSAKVTSSS